MSAAHRNLLKALLVVFLALLGAAPPAGAEDPLNGRREQGPFEERNQFLFNLLFLAFPARGGTLLPAGAQEILLTQVYANTFVGSDVFFTLSLNSPSNAREQLTPSTLAAARALKPEEALYFVDTEQGRTELRYRAGLGRHFEAGLEIPFLSYRGGSFDGPIEAYHNNLRLGNGGRNLYTRDETQIALSLGGATYLTDRSPGLYRMGDISLFGRVALVRGVRGNLALSLGLKLPTGDPDRLAGSGGTDAGVGLQGTKRWGHHRLHLGADWVRVGRWSSFARFDPADLGSLLAGYEFVAGDTVSWIGQLQSQSTVFRGRADNRLADPTTELLAGVRWKRRDRWSFEAAFIENILNQNSGVDIGIRIGAAARLGKR